MKRQGYAEPFGLGAEPRELHLGISFHVYYISGSFFKWKLIHLNNLEDGEIEAYALVSVEKRYLGKTSMPFALGSDMRHLYTDNRYIQSDILTIQLIFPDG